MRVGQRVTCIDASGFVSTYGEKFPIRGQTYTVRSIVGQCIRLKEIVNKPAQYKEGLVECSFKATRFKRGK